MQVRNAVSPGEARQFDTTQLREAFLIQDLFKPGELSMTYSHIDRIIAGGAVPEAKELALAAGKEIGADSFLERRELGLINIGSAGTISVDGIDIRDVTRDNLRRTFGMVLQDAWLFGGTIRENIAYGRETATEDEVLAAARAANVDHFVRTLPEGYDMELNEEITNVSQGEKQLLTIARAVLADPKMLILDEATSSVDTRTEVLIQQADWSADGGR